MFQKITHLLGGNFHKRELNKLSKIADEVNSLESAYESMSDDVLRAKTDEFRNRLKEGESLDDLLVEAFATVRETTKRKLGQRQYDVQIIGGAALHKGEIIEMRTGEGKTLVATMPVYLNALTGKGVHLVTVNDYLARRDARWMAPIYNALGLTVGVLQMANRTENGQKAFLVNLERTSSQEDQHQLQLVDRQVAYQADVVYGTNSEFGFDYLRDNLTMRLEDRVQHGHNFAIIDEVDNILIDEARTPLIISGPASEDSEWYIRMAQVVRQLNPEDYEISERDKTVTLTEIGEAHVEEILDMPLRDPERPEDIAPEQARVLGFLEQALRAQFLYRRNKEYLVQGGKVLIIDEFTGRLMPGRRWSEGLHQAVEAKEGVKVEPENVTYATITIQNYFRMYSKLAGMTGTALTEAEEFSKIYKLEVFSLPTNLEYSAERQDSNLVSVTQKDEDGYRCTFYADREDQEKKPLFWKRKDYPDIVYLTEEAKLRAMIQEILYYYVIGRPQLVGTTSVENSERLSSRMTAESIRKLTQVLLLRQAWMEQNNRDFIERSQPELKPLSVPLHDLVIPELRRMARSLDISLNPEDPDNISRLLSILSLRTEDVPRLVSALQGGIPHQVLNARKHDEESQIIARAGAFGAVTIATNMAGRGVDIKLGGELSEELIADIVRVLAKSGYEDPYNMTNQERRKALKDVPAENYGIYEESVQAFLKAMEDSEKVRKLGGLHVIGSERHEARRIDNQLRGRAARQGDPGSSRFYLSLEDDLMRIFGGQQAEGMFKRLKVDENMPIEHNILGRLVEQSQERVEGSNFDVRKHLLEYDDVLNAQRERIYAQRDLVFRKDDLTEDIQDMLRIELRERIPQALKDKEGPWKLLAFLDETQPTLEYEKVLFPSFSLSLLLDNLDSYIENPDNPTPSQIQNALLKLAESALEAEKEHLFTGIQTILEQTEDNLDTQLEERYDALDTFFDNLDENEEATSSRPQDMLLELSSLTHISLKLDNDQLRRLPDGDKDVKDALKEQVKSVLQKIAIQRISAAIERRLEERLDSRIGQGEYETWAEAADQLLEATENTFEERKERLLGADGQIARDLAAELSRTDIKLTETRSLINLLRVMMQGTRVSFDRRTHRRGKSQYNRLKYVYLAARLMADAQPEELTEDILEHLTGAQEALQKAWGMMEWQRLSMNEVTLSQIEDRVKKKIQEHLGIEHFEEIDDAPLQSLDEEDQQHIQHVLGDRLQNEIYRHLLLTTISDQWIEYLTKVEALRVSIGLEAYAQRDPLVVYKGKATEMFKELLGNIRMAVISKMFTYRPRQGNEAAVEKKQISEAIPASTQTQEDTSPATTQKTGVVEPSDSEEQSKRRRRHKRR